MEVSPVPEPYRTPDQVEGYLAHIFPPGSKFHIYPTAYGWVCHPNLSADNSQNTTQPSEPGQANFVVNARTGAVTVHPSLHPALIGKQYDEAIRNGLPIPGDQIYPLRWRVTLQRTREDETELEYQVTAASLIEPAEPTNSYLLIIGKKTLQPRRSLIEAPEPFTRAMTWARRHYRTTSKWPETGMFEY
ncbi:hypothetical protein AB0N05_21910 [Nocardia sp. NPDC051030]|uniref:hypothetical protein n=1 Tax=Nocardia sp. NPDC051030 TaxID=3155162 RepID=UPI00343CA4C8